MENKELIEETANRFNRLSNYGEWEESGAARALDILRGLVPSIQTFAILTAENPCGTSYNDKLEKDLKHALYGFQKCKGRYGTSEHSYFVPNIRRQTAMKFGLDYEQKSIIWGKKTYTTKKNIVYSGMNMQFILTTKAKFGMVDSGRTVFVSEQNADDYFTVIRGRKFYIPFFDDAMKDAQWVPGSGAIKKEEKMPEWYINNIEQLVERALNEEKSNLYHKAYNDRGGLIIELGRYRKGLYENKDNEKFFGLADGYFTGELILKDYTRTLLKWEKERNRI